MFNIDARSSSFLSIFDFNFKNAAIFCVFTSKPTGKLNYESGI
ncbi:hypothetical protein EV678_2840 [Azospira oryzae]|uniref:Uncharacterized protein n=1 Tax=Azospira oryzae TaxID=146939 RepID=A0ABY0IPP4_9RHOO|nr:hypothetical protein EV678_2840 [Azospira oryzae]